MRQIPKHQLQIAFDMLSLNDALRICAAVVEHADVIEVGTPLIKAVGIDSIARMRKEHPETTIVADMKTVDTGGVDARMAFDNGADGVIVQAFAPPQTVRSVVNESRKQGKFCMIDSLGMNDMIQFERVVEHSGANYAIVHTGIDEQSDGYRPLERLKCVVNSQRLPKLAVAGGIGPETVADIVAVMSSGIIIVGASITRSLDPKNTAYEVKRRMVDLLR